jgi:chromosome segregation protein
VHLKSLTLKGFKSFPDRTRLDFAPGVSVVVGPNGSGKSNITDAVLWAMGEQSPLAVRGSSMQDVIFGGGHGVQARSAAEVELVLDNSDDTVGLPFSEISILRRLTRAGEGEYRLNGARCRLVDVLEALSDTGLGKETHSIISQGRVEAIVLSRPRERRLLIEEAAGLGKHRKRRRRAQLKLERTQDNLDRALDVEREARSRLRPLKRQAEAAELHARLEHQVLEARLALAREALRVRRLELADAEEQVGAARAGRAAVEGDLREVAERRAHAERALAERSERHDELSRRALHAGAAAERLQLRHEQAAATAAALVERIERSRRELALLEQDIGSRTPEASEDAGATRIEALERELAELELAREQQLEQELAELERAREEAAAELTELDAALAAAREARGEADEHAEQARAAVREAERAVDAARRDAARVGSELAAVNQFLRHAAPHAAASAHAGGAEGGDAEHGGARTLSVALRVEQGYELALAAALGARLDAVLVPDLARAAAVLDRAGPDGAAALLSPPSAPSSPAQEGSGSGEQAVQTGSGAPPAPGARLLLELVDGPPEVLALARRQLADTWVLERLELPDDFAGVAVTPQGRVLFGATGEVRQVAEGGAERVLARRREREELIAAVERAAVAEHAARAAAERAQEDAHAAEEARAEADEALRETTRDRAHGVEQERQAAWLIEQRRAAPEQGPLAVRRAQLEGELAAERRAAERLAREHAERVARLERLRALHAADTALAPLAERLAAALGLAGEVVVARAAELGRELDSHRAAGEAMAGELRACAAHEAEIQARLRAQGEAVTAAEVAAQRLRDHAEEAALELRAVREQLGLPGAAGERGEGSDAEVAAPAGAQGEVELATDSRGADVEGEGEPATDHGGADVEALDEHPEPLDEQEVAALTARLERLRRRREQLGPVNPLAQEEYAEALAHVEELEARRGDLETALRELRTVIRDTDRQIHETFQATFEAAARNFEELAADLFPGGRGRLRLVEDAPGPRPVLGGQSLDGPSGGAGAESAAAAGGAAEAETGGAEGRAASAAEGAGGAEGAGAEDGAGGEDGAGDAGGAPRGESDAEGPDGHAPEDLLGVEIEITPAGKATKRLSLLSGGEKSMTALAFLFAVFLARPCPFYILDEVEAALDDLNLERFLTLLRRYAGRAQFIVITHQRRTMEAADALYGVSMAGNGVSRVISRRLPADTAAQNGSAPAASAPVGIAPEDPVAAEPARTDSVSEDHAAGDPAAQDQPLAQASPLAMAEVA